MSDEHNIIPINPATAKPLAIVRKEQAMATKCYGVHKRIEVDDQARTVTCLECGFVLDPFEYLIRWANEGDRRMGELKNIEVRTKVACAELNSLTHQIKLARATLKRHGKPQSREERQEFDRQRWNAGNPRVV